MEDDVRAFISELDAWLAQRCADLHSYPSTMVAVGRSQAYHAVRSYLHGARTNAEPRR
jgi:hypothetical protein